MLSLFSYGLVLLTVPMLLTAHSEGCNKAPKGTIIFLNGPSASGKSSIQNELQKIMDEPYLKVGIDTFFDALIPNPDLSQFEKERKFEQLANDGTLIRGVKLDIDSEGRQIVPLEIGPTGDKIMFGMHSAIAAYADKGNNLIVDYILYKQEWLPDLVNSLQGNKVYFIGIKADLGTLEERERKRGTSPIGHSRSHYDSVHSNTVYDLEIDVSCKSPMESAQIIKDFIRSENNPTALKKMATPRSCIVP